jgi:hypothetical protein
MTSKFSASQRNFFSARYATVLSKRAKSVSAPAVNFTWNVVSLFKPEFFRNVVCRACFTRFRRSKSPLKFELELVTQFETFVRIA